MYVSWLPMDATTGTGSRGHIGPAAAHNQAWTVANFFYTGNSWISQLETKPHQGTRGSLRTVDHASAAPSHICLGILPCIGNFTPLLSYIAILALWVSTETKHQCYVSYFWKTIYPYSFESMSTAVLCSFHNPVLFKHIFLRLSVDWTLSIHIILPSQGNPSSYFGLAENDNHKVDKKKI